MPGILIIAEHPDGALRDIPQEMIGAAVSVKEGFAGPLTVALVSNNTNGRSAAVNLHGADQIAAVGAAGDHSYLHVYEEAPIRLDEKPGASIWCTAKHTKARCTQIKWYTIGIFVDNSWHTDLGVRLRRPRSSCSATPRKRGASMTCRTLFFQHGTSCPPRTPRFATLKPIKQAKQKPFAAVAKTRVADGSRGCELMREKRGA